LFAFASKGILKNREGRWAGVRGISKVLLPPIKMPPNRHIPVNIIHFRRTQGVNGRDLLLAAEYNINANKNE
jgi:hypothetical protein